MESYEPEDSVASILMSLSNSCNNNNNQDNSFFFKCSTNDSDDFIHTNTATTSSTTAMITKPNDRISSLSSASGDINNKLKILINSALSDDGEDDHEFDSRSDLLLKDKSLCSTAELEMIRRERNRMHAKKTRLRKKRMLSEMETVSQW